MIVSITFNGQTFDVTGEFSPGEPDVYYLPNGDPGHPGTPDEFEIHQITWTSSIDGDTDVTELIDAFPIYWDEIQQRVIEKILEY